MVRSTARRWRKGSEFGEGLRVPMCRQTRKVWKARVEMHRRAGRITAQYALVAGVLVRRLGHDGRLDPTQATIARDAGVPERTVRRALKALRECGLLMWVRRLVRDGLMARQTSNSYAITLGEAPKIKSIAYGGHDGRGSSKDILSKAQIEAQSTPPADVAAARAALERIGAERRAFLAREWLKGRGGSAARG